jgi:hypothetical protein
VDRVIALENELDDLRERCLSLDVETEQFRALVADAAEKVAAAIDGICRRLDALESPSQHAAEDMLPVVNGEP